MAIGWNFPSNNYGTLNGIGEAGIETFKGTPYRSLAREICQNSLDAIENCLDFFRKAVKVIRQETIPILRISDFHTTGLLGSAQDYNTPWQKLVKASGVSDKGDGLGGSFGEPYDYFRNLM